MWLTEEGEFRLGGRGQGKLWVPSICLVQSHLAISEFDLSGPLQQLIIALLEIVSQASVIKMNRLKNTDYYYFRCGTMKSCTIPSTYQCLQTALKASIIP